MSYTSHIAPLSSAPLSGFIISTATPTNRETISAFNRHFWQTIMAQIPHTVSLRMGAGNSGSGNFTDCFNNNFYGSDEDAQIRRWLSPLEPQNRHEGVRTNRVDGIGDWLLETSEFREWRQGEGGADKAVLFCYGDPGVGKTYLSSLVIDSLYDQATERDIAVAGLYCDFLTQKEQTITHMTGAILKELVGRNIPQYLREAFRKEFAGRGLRLPDLVRLLGRAIASLPPVFICIDALDELLPGHLLELLESLGDIVRESPRTRVFLTGRPPVGQDIQRCFPGTIAIPISPNPDDIKNYLERRLAKDTKREAMNDGLRADIVRIILDKMSDIFLLVSLNIEAILAEVTIRKRRRKLEEMARGNGLTDAYTAALTRLEAQEASTSSLGMNVLMWVLHSERPLRAEELRHALGVELGSEDLDLEDLPALRILLSSCLGLVTIEPSSSTIRLVHFTLKEHLLSNPTLFRNPHSTIAEVCLTYLNFACFWDLSPAPDSTPAEYPLEEYASGHWRKHARLGMTDQVKALALRLLNRQGAEFGARFG